MMRLLLPAVLALLSLAGCSLPAPQADTVRYFTLSGGSVGPAAPDALTVRPVRLAGHLRNRSLAVRVSENEVTYLEDARWAGPLDEAVTQVLRNRLRQVGGAAVVTVQLQRFELVRNEGNTVQLAATYAITPQGGGEARTGAFTATPRPWAGGDHGGIVTLMHAALDELADAIAATAAAK
jgi:uncharacterized lipoprotein YmbA